MINITLENFQTELVQASSNTAILLDIWAPWCEPCKQLSPILEQLELDYNGRFVLAKLDADAVPEISQQLSQMFGVRSIPFCVMFKDGQPVDGFVGCLPKAEIIQFLDKYVPSAQSEQQQQQTDLVEQAIQSGDVKQALYQLEQNLAQSPDNQQVRFDYAKLLLQQQDFSSAQQVLQAPQADTNNSKLQALNYWLQAQQVAQSGIKLEQLEQQISNDKRNFTARLQKAQLLISKQQWTQAMDELAEILMRDKDWNDAIARKTYIAVLDIIEPLPVKVEEGKIPPQDQLVVSYRRRLSSLVLS